MLINLTPSTPITISAVRAHHAEHLEFNPDGTAVGTFSPNDLHDHHGHISYRSWSGMTALRIHHDGAHVTRIEWQGPASSFAGGVWWLRPTWQADGSVSLMSGSDRWSIESVETTRVGDLLDRLEVPDEHRATVDAVVRERAPLQHEVPVEREPEPVWTGEPVEFSRGGRRGASA